MTWKSVRLDTALDRPEYILELEEFRNPAGEQMMFIHLTVRSDWSLALLRRFKAEWRVLLKHINVPLYACGTVDDDKWAKFVSLFGFTPLSEAICTDGQRRRIYWHQGSFNGKLDSTTTKRQFKRALVRPTAISTASL